MFESWFDAKEIEESEEASTDKILQQEQKNSVVNMMHQILLPFLRHHTLIECNATNLFIVQSTGYLKCGPTN